MGAKKTSSIIFAGAALGLINQLACSDVNTPRRTNQAAASGIKDEKKAASQDSGTDNDFLPEIDGFVDASDPAVDRTPPVPTKNVPVAPNIVTSSTAPAPTGTEEHVILDFEGSDTVPDKAWLLKQAPKKVYTYIGPKGDSGNDRLYLGQGQGRNGSNALVVESTDAKMGLPGFWVLRGTSSGTNATNREGYLLPTGKRANQIEFWLKFPVGFRRKFTSSAILNYPNHQNFHLGTYNFDPAKIGGGAPVKESDNWHFYHQIYLRHDKADETQDGWIRVVINESPQHQRGFGGSPANNPTAPFGNYYEIMTRFYLDCDKYFADPEIDYPIKMLVDDIKFRYVPPQKAITVEFDEYKNGAGFQTSINKENKVPFTISNNESSGQDVRVLPASLDGFSGVAIVDEANKNIGPFMTLPPNSNTKLYLKFIAKGAIRGRDVSVNVVPKDQIKSDSGSSHRSLSDENVEKRWSNQAGPTDAEVKSTFLNVVAK